MGRGGGDTTPLKTTAWRLGQHCLVMLSLFYLAVRLQSIEKLGIDQFYNENQSVKTHRFSLS